MQEVSGVSDGESSDRIRNSISGSEVHGPAIQVGHAGAVFVNDGSRLEDGEQAGKDEDRGTRRAALWPMFAFFVVVLTVISECSGSGQVPDDSGSWPAEIRREAVMKSVSNSLHDCAESVVLDPVNCPQRQENGLSGAAKVDWSLRGDALDGAGVVFSGDSFYVYGNSVMTVWYEYGGLQPSFETRVVPYVARVSRDGARVEKLEMLKEDPPRKVVKRDPQLSRESVVNALRDGFTSCSGSLASAVVPNCPVASSSVPGDEDGHLKFEGDPTLNSRQAFDSNSGMVEVIGSYAATVSYEDPLLESMTMTKTGVYRARIIAEWGFPRVLQIEDCGVECT